MLRIFIRIRKSLLESSAIRKYMLYAIGEIALVVIGILIALQINNWNEWKKDRIKEMAILNDLRQNLERNIDLLNTHIDVHKENNNSAMIVISSISNAGSYSDTLDKHFHLSRIELGNTAYLSSAGYEAYKDIGFDIVRNKNLKDEILNLFEVFYSSNMGALNWFTQINPLREDYLYKNFLNEEQGAIKPKNYKLLIKDSYYKSMLYDLYRKRIYWIEILNNCKSETERVLNLIGQELKKN